MAGSINKVSGNASKQLGSISEATASVEQLPAGIQQIIISNDAVNKTSSLTAAAAGNGVGTFNTAISQMNNRK